MIESKYSPRRFLGFGLFIVGTLGIVYLTWVYVIWGNTLPTFDNQDVFFESSRETVVDQSVTFGSILPASSGSYEPLAVIANSEPISQSSGSEIVIDRQPARNNTQVHGVSDLANVELTIPRLNIDRAKVELDVNGSHEYVYDTVLTRAVAHLENSAYPGDFGNTFLFGHSKLPIFAGNDYESIFTNLPKVKVGDIVEVKHGGKLFTYQISQTGVVDPSDVFVMNQPDSKKMLTLMTCIPPGFENQRYITVGELIDIDEISSIPRLQDKL